MTESPYTFAYLGIVITGVSIIIVLLALAS